MYTCRSPYSYMYIDININPAATFYSRYMYHYRDGIAGIVRSTYTIYCSYLALAFLANCSLQTCSLQHLQFAVPPHSATICVYLRGFNFHTHTVLSVPPTVMRYESLLLKRTAVTCDEWPRPSTNAAPDSRHG